MYDNATFNFDFSYFFIIRLKNCLKLFYFSSKADREKVFLYMLLSISDVFRRKYSHNSRYGL